MTKITLTQLTDLQNELTAVSNINNNSNTITAAIDNTLSRDGTQPNKMGANLDMNSFRVLNLPVPVNGSEPLRLQDAATLNGGGTITSIPAGGTTGQRLTKNSNNSFDTSWQTGGSGTVTSVGLSMPVDFTVTNSPVSVSGTLTASYVNTPTGTGSFVRASSPTISTPTLTSPNVSTLVNTGTLTLPTSSDTLIGRATTDTLTNKTIDTAGTGNAIKVNGVQVSRGQYVGTNTNDNASSGNIGEFIASNIVKASAVSMTSTSPANITSIVLTPGDWDVCGIIYTLPAGTTNTGYVQGCITPTSATMVTDSGTNTTAGQFWMPGTSGTGGATASGGVILSLSPCRVSISTNTTYYLVSAVQFSTSTLSVYGNIQARRVR